MTDVYVNKDDYLQQKGDVLSKKVFVGGPVRVFERMGRSQLITLLHAGLYPHSKVLDIGCGCLRGGYWLIHFLDPGCYFGIEPNREMLEAGRDGLLEEGLLEAKQPRFDHHDDFGFSRFGVKFDFVIARSIWSHASKSQIEKMLDEFAAHAHPKSVFLASYLRPSLMKRDYKGAGWVGKSHQSQEAGLVYHKLQWIAETCAGRGLEATEPGFEMFNGQRWLYITPKGR
ncbi:MAG: hypothetical protein CMJ18_24335 [Phycisphaeraceae bacterium]|nr:hypothetical protein [Phycisphaeraceae bacterium]